VNLLTLSLPNLVSMSVLHEVGFSLEQGKIYQLIFLEQIEQLAGPTGEGQASIVTNGAYK